jgi:hypothetical protein
MRKDIKILLVLIGLNLFWAFAYAYVGDFHPKLRYFKDILLFKTIFNTFGILAWCCVGVKWDGFPKEG